MPKGRQSTRIGASRPVSFTLTKALSNIREAQFRSQDGSQARYALGAREMIVLGRLIHSWKDVVGLQAAKKTCPSRFFKGKLFLSVADSQWMQTLLFYKSEMLEKLNALFPDMKITDIIGRPGKIPQEAEKLLSAPQWPDWHNEEAVDFTRFADDDFAALLDRCARKSAARVKGLVNTGYVLCKSCSGGLTTSADGICAICRYHQRQKSRNNAREIIHEMPWLTFEDMAEIDGSLSSVEIESIRQELLNETLSYVDEIASMYMLELLNADCAMSAGAGTVSDRANELHQTLSREMTRAVMLHCGCMPDDVDFRSLSDDQMPSKYWESVVPLVTGELKC